MNISEDLQRYLAAHPEFSAGADTLARVTAVHRDRLEARIREEELPAQLDASLRPAGERPVVGDYVRFEYREDTPFVTGILPRTSFFSRADPDPLAGEQAVAANFDTVCVVTSLNQDFNPARIERYLTQALSTGAEVVVVLTKSDLVDDPLPYLAQVTALCPGIPAVALSTITGAGMEGLTPYFGPGRTLVLLGSSGVGKSSLLNALLGEARMAVGEIRYSDGRGRHTTTCRQTLALPDGTQIIDTPGMRMLGMWDASGGLDTLFPDVEACVAACRFSDCTHGQEPGCAVRAALESGELDPARLEAYQQLRFEDELSRRRANMARRKLERNTKKEDRARRPRQKRFDIESL